MRSRVIKKLIVLLLIVCLSATIANATIRKGPYLIYPGTNTEMMVLWQLTNSRTCTLEWGEDTTYSTGSVQTTEYGTDHQHKYTISGLAPGTKYYYRVTEDVSHTGSFYAAPSTTATSIKLLAYGDTRNNPQDQDPVNARMITEYTSDPGYQTITLFSGDWVDKGRTESDWTRDWFNRDYPNMLEMRKNIPINGCYSNHDTMVGTSDDGDLLAKYYPYPYVTAPHYLCDNAHYYSFDYGPVHVTVIDQYDSSYGVISDSQLDWIESDLAATDRTWKILIFHEPGWSAGTHSNNAQVQDDIQPLCIEYDAKLTIAGHNHNYARAVKNQITHITSGGGGAPLGNVDPDDPFIVTAEKTYNFCKIDIVGDNLTFTAVRPDGTIIESFNLTPTHEPELPWSDGFESGDFKGGMWSTSNSYCTVQSSDVYEGTYAAQIEKTGWIEKEVSTYGFTDIHVKYARKTAGYDVRNYLHVEWSVDGATYYNLESTQDASWAFVDKTCGTGANNSKFFRVRFSSAAGKSEYAFVDSVQVTGTAIVVGDFDGNGSVNFGDLDLLTNYWLISCSGPGWCEGCDIDESGRVDFTDFAYLGENWSP